MWWLEVCWAVEFIIIGVVYGLEEAGKEDMIGHGLVAVGTGFE